MLDSENLLGLSENLLGANFPSLIIYKSSRRAALTIANAPFTICAAREAALTSFEINKATSWMN